MRERDTLLKEKYVSVQAMKRGYLLGMPQTIFEQNLSPIDWKMKALRKI